MESTKLYITLFVYLHEGEAETFLEYEDKVLPLLSHYNGELLYRIRPERNNFVQAADDYPYEIHLLTFNSASDFENFRQDKERLSHLPLFQNPCGKFYYCLVKTCKYTKALLLQSFYFSFFAITFKNNSKLFVTA